MANSPQEPNTIGNASLWLGILSVVLVFGIGLCTAAGFQQGWIAVAATPLFICGASSAFIGVIAFFLGLGGLFGKNRSKAVAVAGALLGGAGFCIFLLIMSRVGG